MTRGSQHRRRLAMVAAGAAVAIAVVLGFPAPAHAATVLYVDNGNVACSDQGSGTVTVPFCTIGASVAKVSTGMTVQVASGTYVERVSINRSGTPGAPITWTAASGATVTVTGGANGFALSSVHDVTISGFHVTHTTSYGLKLQSSWNIILRNNEVSYSGAPFDGSTAVGIYVQATNTSVIVANSAHHNTDAGIYLLSGSTGDVVAFNSTFSNARGYTRAAPGIDVRAPGNIVTANVSHNNEDSGIQFYSGADNSVATDNVVYRNGDHGIDVLSSAGLVIVGNTVYKNTTSGINVEGGSSGTTIRDNISQDNALSNTFGQKGNIRVDATSVPGSSMDSDLLYLSAAGGKMVQWNGTSYSTLAAFRAAVPQQETHGIQAIAKFVNAVAGDLHLRAGSAAIDSADASAPAFTSTDADGKPRFDAPGKANTGRGVPPYADRGAFEYQG